MSGFSDRSAARPVDENDGQQPGGRVRHRRGGSPRHRHRPLIEAADDQFAVLLGDVDDRDRRSRHERLPVDRPGVVVEDHADRTGGRGVGGFDPERAQVVAADQCDLAREAARHERVARRRPERFARCRTSRPWAARPVPVPGAYAIGSWSGESANAGVCRFEVVDRSHRDHVLADARRAAAQSPSRRSLPAPATTTMPFLARRVAACAVGASGQLLRFSLMLMLSTSAPSR